MPLRVSEDMHKPGLVVSVCSKLKMALSSSSDVAGPLKLGPPTGEVTGVGVEADVAAAVAECGVGDEGKRLSLGSDPFVFILVVLGHPRLCCTASMVVAQHVSTTLNNRCNLICLQESETQTTFLDTIYHPM